MTPTSATGERAGFTLIEVMVVVAILGIAASAIVLTIPGLDDNVGRQAQRLAARLAHAREEAVIGGRPIEALLTPSGYRFEAVSGGERTVMSEALREVKWPLGTKASDEMKGRIVFDPTGAAQGGRIVIVRDGQTAEVTVDAAGKVTVHAPQG